MKDHPADASRDTTPPDDAATGAEVVVRMLQAHGVQHIFGLCGDTSLPFYDALARLDHGITHVLARDERSAAYMADGYARITDRVGICEGPSGGGATYILPGLVEANESSVPVLAITTDVGVPARGHFPLTELDQTRLMAPLTKWNKVIDTVGEIPQTIRSAFRAMTTGTPGSAHIGLPYDIQKQVFSGDDLWAQPEHGRVPAWRQGVNPQAIRAGADRLLAAKLPVFVCGGGVVTSGACEALELLANALDAPVCTTVTGKGAIAETHPLAVGVVGANGGVTATREVLAEADLVIFVAARAGSTTTEHGTVPGPGVPVIHIDTNPMAISCNYHTDVALVADAKLALEALGQEVASRIEERTTGARDGAAIALAAQRKKWDDFNAIAASDALPVRPEKVFDTLNRLLPEDAVVVADPGTPCPYAAAYFRIRKPGRHFITNRAHGALGYALSAGIGAWFGRPDVPVVALMGDGSFGFTVGELETLRRHGVPLKMIVFSNAEFGWIKASQKAGYEARYFSVDFTRTDHAAVAEAYGIRAFRVDEPAEMEPVLHHALAHDGPALIDVICQPLEEAAVPVSKWMG